MELLRTFQLFFLTVMYQPFKMEGFNGNTSVWAKICSSAVGLVVGRSCSNERMVSGLCFPLFRAKIALEMPHFRQRFEISFWNLDNITTLETWRQTVSMFWGILSKSWGVRKEQLLDKCPCAVIQENTPVYSQSPHVWVRKFQVHIYWDPGFSEANHSTTAIQVRGF